MILFINVSSLLTWCSYLRRPYHENSDSFFVTCGPLPWNIHFHVSGNGPLFLSESVKGLSPQAIDFLSRTGKRVLWRGITLERVFDRFPYDVVHLGPFGD